MLAIVLIGIGIVWLGSWALTKMSGPRVVTSFSDIDFYGAYPHPQLVGDKVVYASGATESFASAVKTQNEVFVARYNGELANSLGLGFVFVAGGVVVYVALRAIGWVFAGAAKS